MKVMSFNVRINVEVDKEHAWPYRKDQVLSYLLKLYPDIIGLQEPNQGMLSDLNPLLELYSMVGLPRQKNGEYTPIYYNKARFEYIQTETFWLTETPKEESKLPDSAYTRIATYLHLKHSIKGDIHLVNTHLDYQSEAIQVKQIKVILDYLSPKLGTHIIMGDFNAYPNAAVHKTLQDAGYTSNYAPSQEKEVSFHDFQRQAMPEPIDYIYTKNILEPRKIEIINDVNTKYLSDHYPILLNF